MTDEKTGSELVTVNTPAGERHLKRLSPADWVKLGNTLRASRKAELRAELGASAATRAKVLKDCIADVRAKMQAGPQDKNERMILNALTSVLDSTEAETRKALDAFDRRPLRSHDVEAFVNTLEGQYAAIMYSLQKDKPDAGEEDFNALGLQPNEWLGVTGDLLNLRVVERPLAETGESPPTNETGTGTPAGSAST